MNKRMKPPQYIMDLVIGYCKQKYKSSIPICLKTLFAVYFFLRKKEILFGIRFKYLKKFAIGFDNNGQLIYTKYFRIISSISSYCIISNKCDKLILRIGNALLIKINIGQSKINVTTPKQSILLTDVVGNVWKINRKLTNYIEIMIRLNRKTNCNCNIPKSNGSLQIFFRNIQQIPEMNSDDSMNLLLQNSPYRTTYSCHPRKYGQIVMHKSDGYCIISLKDDFNFNSNEKVSIETYGIDAINAWSSKHAHYPCDKFGYGDYCCNC